MEYLPKKETSEVPFLGNLVDSNIPHPIAERLTQIEGNPNKIIRSENLDDLSERYKIEPMKLVEITKELYKELEEKYGISVPVEFVIGKDQKSQKVIYSIVDKIDGKTLDNIKEVEKASEQVQNLYTSIAKYFCDKFREGGFYLTDINGPTQYIFGKKHGEEKDKIYLIDSDVFIHNRKIGIYTVVEWLARHTKGMEVHFKTRFEKVREYISEIISQPLPDKLSDEEKERVDRNIVQIKKFLNGEPFDFSVDPAIPSFFMELE